MKPRVKWKSIPFTLTHGTVSHAADCAFTQQTTKCNVCTNRAHRPLLGPEVIYRIGQPSAGLLIASGANRRAGGRLVVIGFPDTEERSTMHPSNIDGAG